MEKGEGRSEGDMVGNGIGRKGEGRDGLTFGVCGLLTEEGLLGAESRGGGSSVGTASASSPHARVDWRRDGGAHESWLVPAG